MRVPQKYASIERGNVTSIDPDDEAEIIESIHPFTDGSDEPLLIRVDAVPEDTIALSPDDAAAKAIAIQKLSNNGGHQLGFKIEYWV